MCLTCCKDIRTNRFPPPLKEASKLLAFGDDMEVPVKGEIMWPDGGCTPLTKEIAEEIKAHALVVVATGIDLSTCIWAIQWPTGYTSKTIKKP